LLPQNGSYWISFFPPVVIMGFGMTISVAPLTTTVMNAVPESESGLASGMNNAVSRLGSLLAIAVFGALLVTVFNHSLDQQLQPLKLSAELTAQVNEARPQLAAAKISDPHIQSAIASSFVDGYRVVIWVATGLEVLGALIAWLLIGSAKPDPELSRAEQ
jgi:MFS family permease